MPLDVEAVDDLTRFHADIWTWLAFLRRCCPARQMEGSHWPATQDQSKPTTLHARTTGPKVVTSPRDWRRLVVKIGADFTDNLNFHQWEVGSEARSPLIGSARGANLSAFFKVRWWLTQVVTYLLASRFLLLWVRQKIVLGKKQKNP